MPVTLDSTSAPFVRFGKKLKLSPDGGDSGSKKCKRGYGGVYGGVWRSLRLARVWSQAVGFLLVWFATVSTSEMSVICYQSTRRNITVGSHLHTRRRENLKYSLQYVLSLWITDKHLTLLNYGIVLVSLSGPRSHRNIRCGIQAKLVFQVLIEEYFHFDFGILY
jgi:hypothetical protein